MLFLKRFLLFFLLLSTLTSVVSFYLGKPLVGIDDANIFFNYAHHFQQGKGFVFNVNGERVEGFTSLLWVLICALFYWFSPHPETLLILFSLLLTSLTVTLIYQSIEKDIQKLNERFCRRYLLLTYILFIIAIAPSFIAWSVLSLMENALWNFLFTSLVILILESYKSGELTFTKKILLVLIGSLLMLARPEAVVWNLFFAVLLIRIAWIRKKSFLFPAGFVIIVLATMVSLYYFRLNYFGYPLPNTYYAKVSSDKLYNLIEGSKYAFGFLTAYNPVITFTFVMMIVALTYRLLQFIKLIKINFSETVIIDNICLISIVILIGFFLPLTTGGDHFGGFRFYQSLLLFFSFSITATIWFYNQYKNADSIKLRSIFFIVVGLFSCLTGMNTLLDLTNPVKTQLNFEFKLAGEGRHLANDLNNIWQGTKPSAGMIAVGGFGLEYAGQTIDLMGLNNVLMGHSAGDRKGIKNHAAFNKDVFYILQPDVILPALVKNSKEAITHYYELLDSNNFENQAMKNIFNDSSFKKIYVPAFISANNKGTSFFAFVNRSVVAVWQSNKNISINILEMGF